MNRREMLKNAGMIAGVSTVDIFSPGSAKGTEPVRKLKVIVCGGHPGDPEYGCGGTIARLTALDHKVVLLYLNDGAWMETSSTVRIAEARKACEILKARPAYANQINGHAVVDNSHYEAFRKIIETEKPDGVFTHWPIDNHPDHRAITSLIYESWKQLDRKFPLYYYEVSNGEDTVQFPAPTHYVDISNVVDVKRASCYAHASQSPDFFYGIQDTVARFRGLQNGSKSAEAYVLQAGSPHDILTVVGLSRG
jgi:N-acetylglucosamine malate deacetylase 1